MYICTVHTYIHTFVRPIGIGTGRMEMPAMGRAGDQCGGEWVGVGRGLHVCSRVVRVFHALNIWLDSQKGEIELVGLREKKRKQASKQASK